MTQIQRHRICNASARHRPKRLLRQDYPVLQDLHPQTGPFAPGGEGTKKNASRQGKGNKKAAVRHRDPKSKSAKKDRRALLDTSPGEKVFVVPFQTAATLVRIDEDKNKATVLRGAFEIQVALSDLEPVGYQKEKRTP